MNIVSLKKVHGLGISRALSMIADGAKAQGLKTLAVSPASSVAGVIAMLQGNDVEVVMIDEGVGAKHIVDALKGFEHPATVYVGEYE
jgi:hypothetical protein